MTITEIKDLLSVMSAFNLTELTTKDGWTFKRESNAKEYEVPTDTEPVLADGTKPVKAITDDDILMNPYAGLNP